MTPSSHLGSLRDATVLVIGGAGFLGSHIVEHLTEAPVREVIVFDNFVRGTRANLAAAIRDPRVRIVEGSITEPHALGAVMEGATHVFHLAALWLHECVRDPRSAAEVNVVGTLNVIEAAQRARVKKVVFSSSASVYGDAVFVPMTEEHPFNNRTMYGATKIAGEQFFRAFHEQHGLPFVALRYMNIYGPRMDYRGPYVSVIMRALDRIDEGLPPIIFGDGSQTYDFVHVDDVAKANLLALSADVSDDFLNIGSGVSTTVNTLVKMLLAITESTLEPQRQPDEHIFVTHRVGTIDKAEALLGFRAAIPLEVGLRSVIDWRASRHSPAGGPPDPARSPGRRATT